jgi:hypothetical protein
MDSTWEGENMLNPLLQSHPVFIPMESLHLTCNGTKIGLNKFNENHQFLPPR